MESEKSNSITPQTPLNIEEEIFGPQYEVILNRSIPYHKIQLTAPTNSQGESETCSLCNEPKLLFKPN